MVQHQATRNSSSVGARQDIRKGEGVSLTQLREKVAAAVKAKNARKAKTRTNEKYFKMSRKQLENFLEQERRITLGASITQFVVDVDASDEERAKLKREKVIEKLNDPARNGLRSESNNGDGSLNGNWKRNKLWGGHPPKSTLCLTSL